MIIEKIQWRNLIFACAAELAMEKDLEFNLIPENIPIETPPKSDMGDVAFPMFIFAKQLRMAPPAIAQAISEMIDKLSQKKYHLTTAATEYLPLAESLEQLNNQKLGKLEVVGPYLNIFLFRPKVMERIITDSLTEPKIQRSPEFVGKKIMVEFSCPNTNKPLHLGHLRNDALGESISRILLSLGAEVHKVNLINNRGVHICKSMLAYQKYGNNETPESRGIKSDHFVGEFYVKFAQWAKEDPQAEQLAQEMLKKWEEGDEEIKQLWETMNTWAIDGVNKTYEATGISFDRYYYESDTYLLGRDTILKGLKDGVFYQDEEGTVWVDLEPYGLDKKVLLRRDGTSLYITQDIGTAIHRHEDYPFDSLVYVVASEQQYHFKVLFKALELLGFEWAKHLYHLSYGMVNLPEGKMKSREGTVVDADDLLDQLMNLAKTEILEKDRQGHLEDLDQTAWAIALGALHYYLLHTTPTKDMIFNPKESLSFTGDTGPYLQYTGARIESMLRKRGNNLPGKFDLKAELLTEELEWELVKLLGDFSVVLESAGKEYNPAILAAYLFELTKTFSRYYHDVPILTGAEDKVDSRVLLSTCVRNVLRKGLELVNIPYLEVM
jgi:arginyl-tRNA synthetase